MAKRKRTNPILDAVYSPSEWKAIESEGAQYNDRNRQVTEAREARLWNDRINRQTKKVRALLDLPGMTSRKLLAEVNLKFELRGEEAVSDDADYFSKKLTDKNRGGLSPRVERAVEGLCDEKNVNWRTPIEDLQRRFAEKSDATESYALYDSPQHDTPYPDIDTAGEFAKLISSLRRVIRHGSALQAGVTEGKKIASWEWGYVNQELPIQFHQKLRDPMEFVDVIDRTTVRDVVVWLLEKELDLPRRHRLFRKVAEENEADRIDALDVESARVRLFQFGE